MIDSHIVEIERIKFQSLLGGWYADLKFESWEPTIQQFIDYKTQVGFRSWMLAKSYNY